MGFSAKKIGSASLKIFDGPDPVCEVRDLRLQNVRLRPGGRLLIGEAVPLPLYWEQYANHEHPERNCGSHGSLRLLEENPDRIIFECAGATRSRSVLSHYLVGLSRRADLNTYVIDIQAGLRIADGTMWQVTYNPHHGELEFCNFWPDGVYVPDAQERLLYGGCYIVRRDSVTVIPHHHMESTDKHNIYLEPGDRIAWLLEDENPCIEFLSGGEVTAGVCAYMWDAHLAYRVCTDESTRTLRSGVRYTASLRISSLDRAQGEKIAGAAFRMATTDAEEMPIIVEGLHTFSETFGNTKLPPDRAWPWEKEVVSGDARWVRHALDREVGLDDCNSLRIECFRSAQALWKATALGPAFRQPRFENGERYRLVADVRTLLDSGHAFAAIRLHREGSRGLFDPSSYEVYRSSPVASGQFEWQHIEIVTPPITPAPDRIHLLLQVDGMGSCWFDNVLFTREKG